MKLDAKVFLKDNQLFNVCDSSALDENKVVEFEVEQSVVELGDEVYNEEMLAELREELKKLEATGQYAWIKIISDKALDSADELDTFINTYNHTARRIKDCENVIGFMLSENLLSKGMDAVTDFCEVIAKKHAQYIHMAEKTVSDRLNLTDALIASAILVK